MLKITAIGRLTDHMKLKDVVPDMVVSNFVLACNVGKNRTTFIECTAWNNVAKTIKKNTTKGSRLYICGELKVDEYIDKNNIKQTKYSITVDEYEFLSPKPREEDCLGV
ncbi:MAG: single-stranded DNA-binding protein [Anaerorhabdus sp.]